VEFYFNMSPSQTGAYDKKCFQYIVGYENPKLFESWGRTQGIRFTSTPVENGYQVDIDIPWQALEVKPQAGQSFGFDVGVNLASPGKGRTGDLMWSGDSQNFRDSSLFGRLTLVNSSH
jgi:endo-1,4-beta-xylanase